MNNVVGVGDEVRLENGTKAIIRFVNKQRGLYIMENDYRIYARYEFKPTKWEGDGLGNTGIGVCAKNGSEDAK
jgi:hypothetical protein